MTDAATQMLDGTSDVSTRMWHPARSIELVSARTPWPAAAPMVVPADDVRPLAPGARLPGSRLRILERISDGGCGVVYRGEHVDLQRPLAIKVLRVEMLGVGARELFLDEARTTTRIESPHVVQVVDFGELPDGRVWYAMELLGGRALDQMISDDGPMDAARVIALLRMACKGLAAAHEAGVVHRDVKPQNLVVIQRKGRDHLVVVDFGIAQRYGTRPDAVSGTPEYMSREQIMRGTLDARTDVYGLGCCAYELLTGASVVGACSVSKALLMHDAGLDPQFSPDVAVPTALQQIVRRCLAVEPEQRYSDMHELEAALCEAQISAGLTPARDDLELPRVAPVRRRRIADGMAALGSPRPRRRTRTAFLWSTAFAAAITVLAAWPVEPAAKNLRVQVEREPIAGAVAATVEAPAVARWTAAPDLRAQPIAPVTDAEVRDETPTLVSAAATPPAMIVANAAIAETTTAAPQTAADPNTEALSPDLARAAVSRAQRALRRGDRSAAEQGFRRALELDPTSVEAVAGLADVYFERGDHERALRFAKLAVRRAPKSAKHRVRLGDAYFRGARPKEARAEYTVAQRLGSPVAGRRLAALARVGTGS